MKTEKKDFIEVDFTGKVKDGEIFDSNIKEDIKKAGLNFDAKPFVLCLGEGMFLKSIDDFLTGKEIGDYEIELTPDKAFGNREPNMIKIIPIKIFYAKEINPQQGMMFNFDGVLGKIISVSGGRVITDFNNPLSGKTLIYNIKINRKVDDINEKVKALMDFFFRRQFDFEIKENTLVIKAEKKYSKFVEIFEKKFEDILNMKIKVEEIKDKDNKEESQIST
ncbi:MAG: peptidylprolyl isomerase [archaeon]|nr:peptidylprolyl isomerase [archaeon]